MSQTLKLISKNRKTKRKSFIGLSIGFMILGSKQGIAGYEGVAARIGHFSPNKIIFSQWQQLII